MRTNSIIRTEIKKNKSIKLSGDTLTLLSTEGIELVFKKTK